LTYLFISEAKKLELEILKPCPPHDHKHIVGTYHLAENAYRKAIANALESRSAWASMVGNSELPFSAAELIAGPYRARINAATMIGQPRMFISRN
jgi:1-pyrroline-5-carboxylate dehydrogenase